MIVFYKEKNAMNQKKIFKQDINFLDKPLWFSNLKDNRDSFIWTDIEGYEYRTSYKAPDKVDILILFYLLYKSQKLDFKTTITLSRYEILKECGLLQNSGYYYERLEDSLKRWKNVSIEFHGTFYNGKEYLTIGFGIINDYEIEKGNKIIKVNLNENWLLKIKESNFFKYINFEQYKALKRPISRRLYEILCKNFKGRSEWSIGLSKLGIKLTLSGRLHKTRDGREEEVIYASDVLVAIKPAIKEINHLYKIADIKEKANIHSEDLFTVSFTITGEKQDRIIHFKKHPVESQKIAQPIQNIEDIQPPPEKFQSILEQMQDPLVECLLDPAIAKKNKEQQDEKQAALRQEQLNTLFSQLKKKTDALQDLIIAYYDEKDYDYVLWNIRYANANSNKNYSSFVKMALENDWSREWRDEIKGQQQEMQKKEQKQEEENKKQNALNQERELFKKKHALLDKKTKIKFWEQAQKEQKNQPGNNGMIKFRYAQIVLEYFNQNGESFSKETVGLLCFVNGLVQDIGLQ